MAYPIDWTNIASWEGYQSFGDGGYKKFVYLCRNGSDWYDGAILRADGLTIDRYCTAGNYIELGNVNAAAATLVISAPPGDIASWAVGDEIEIQIDPDERTTISTPSADVALMGVFVVDSITERQGTYTVECLDRMVYMDVEMDWTGFSTNYPIQTVLSNIATQCGITLANSISGFPNDSVGWYTNPTLTCRQVVSAIAEVIGACAFMDWNGELRFAWYAPLLDANNAVLEIGSNIAVSRRTEDKTYSVTQYSIGNTTDSVINVSGGNAEYKIIGNALIEGARDYITVSTLATNITNARYTTAASNTYQFNGGEYTTLPLPYIWPLDVLAVGSLYIPVTHVTYSLNSNMSITSNVSPVLNRSTTFTSAQQTVINNMVSETEAINKHFFYANATGAHITTVENGPDSGNNVLIDSSGVYIRENTNVLAEFTATDARIGESSSAHADISTSGLQVYESDGTTQIANLGYGSGKDIGGGTSNAPYYSLGRRSGTIGNYSVAEGYNSESSGFGSHAEGNAEASGTFSHAEGEGTASGNRSHAEGEGTASGDYGHAEGGSTASGNYSHAEGLTTIASGVASHTEGRGTRASADSAHAQNGFTKASSAYQTAMGKYNVEDTANTYALIIGNGTADNARSNALTIDWNGEISGYAQDYKPGDNVTFTLVTGTGYNTATAGNAYVFFDTYRRFPNKSITVNSVTAAYIRGVSGLILNNVTATSYVNNAQRNSASHGFRFYLTGLPTTNFVANTPIHMTCTVDLTIAN